MLLHIWNRKGLIRVERTKLKMDTSGRLRKYVVSRRHLIGLSTIAAATAAGTCLYLGTLPKPTISTSSTLTTSALTGSTTSSPNSSSTSNMTGPTSTTSTTTQGDVVNLALQSSQAKTQPSSDIFVVNGTTGHDNGFKALLDVMAKNSLRFFKSYKQGTTQGPDGLIAKDDVIIVKVNSQWNERGGTNTDLLRKIIESIIAHPEGFIGEIIVADNGQGRGRGSLGTGGHLDYEKNNAEDVSQSVQKVIDSLAGYYRISTYLWDNITYKGVEEYSEGDFEDGYIVYENVDEKTGIQVSYPKFKTKFESYISFKKGLWSSETRSYDGERLKVINVPVLKTHSVYGVTACMKHYMGVPSDRLTGGASGSFGNSHLSVGKGGMGTLMAETRIPTLNILDAIWVNARPLRGPQSYYETATRVNVVMASKDPVALDYWASKYVLLQVAKTRGYSSQHTVDPDFVPDTPNPSIFSTWIVSSMEEIRETGYQTTLKEDEMNVHVFNL